MLLKLGQHDLSDLFVDTLRFLCQQWNYYVTQLLEYHALTQRILDSFLDGRLDLLLLLLLPGQQLLELVGLLGELLVFAREVVQALEELRLLRLDLFLLRWAALS